MTNPNAPQGRIEGAPEGMDVRQELYDAAKLLYGTAALAREAIIQLDKGVEEGRAISVADSPVTKFLEAFRQLKPQIKTMQKNASGGFDPENPDKYINGMSSYLAEDLDKGGQYILVQPEEFATRVRDLINQGLS
ncbi:MAG: hypothetical protein WC604_03820 [Candidatus Gracilibacteria bacterium]